MISVEPQCQLGSVFSKCLLISLLPETKMGQDSIFKNLTHLGSQMGQMSNQKENYFTDNQSYINSEQFENELEKIVKLGEYLKNVA